jgi:hypothetical protein
VDPANLVRLGGKGPWEPEQNWNYIGIGRLAVDPDLEASSSSELSLGGEYAIIPNGRLGLSYIRRWTNQAIEDMSRDEANTYFLGNPGSGIASEFPEVERTYDAGILSSQTGAHRSPAIISINQVTDSWRRPSACSSMRSASKATRIEQPVRQTVNASVEVRGVSEVMLEGAFSASGQWREKVRMRAPPALLVPGEVSEGCDGVA